ncbi:MAG: 3-dehydroquinate synthase [Actinobacteria bacterium]|nr:3-dehydroquinate synthase [Actinomycetota bacterium]
MIRHVVEVELGDRSYPIYIGDYILQGFVEKFREKLGVAKAAIITNPTVWDIYGNQVVKSLSAERVDYDLIIVPDGENAKSLNVAERVYGELIQKGFERKDAVIALGGGVVGDLAGFVASTYERGIAYIQIPTTLLAQVDSSVGGKVAVNHTLGKNMIGTFYQPSFVYIDVATLKTLSDRDFAGGMAEVIKYAFIKGEPLLSIIQGRRDDISARQMDILAEIATICCLIKGGIVEEDERDTGLRAVLNYGHTLGHAIESISEYKYSHGEAVAVGMVFAAKLSKRIGMVGADVVELHKRIIGSYGLPTTMISASIDKIIQVIERDKKRAMGGHVFVVLDGVGNPVIRNIDREDLISALGEFSKEG